MLKRNIKINIIILLLTCINLNANTNSLESNIIHDKSNIFNNNITLNEISNTAWLKHNFEKSLTRDYEKEEYATRKNFSLDEYIDNKIKNFRLSYIQEKSFGLNKDTYLKLYLDTNGYSFKESTQILDEFSNPYIYNQAIKYINNINDNSYIDNYPISIDGFKSIIKNWDKYNYAGKLHALNKLNIIIEQEKLGINKILELSFLEKIRPNFNPINIELIDKYYEIMIKNNRFDVYKLKAKDPLIIVLLKLKSNNLILKEYYTLKDEILKNGYKYYLLESDYLDKLFLKIENIKPI